MLSPPTIGLSSVLPTYRGASPPVPSKDAPKLSADLHSANRWVRNLALLRSPYSGPLRRSAPAHRGEAPSGTLLFVKHSGNQHWWINAFDVDHSQCLESITDPLAQYGLVSEVQLLESLQ